MKKVFSILCFIAFYAATSFAQAGKTTEAKASGPVMKLQETVVDYGTIEQNSDPLRRFHFTNTGTEPLIITNAKGSCGCTVPDYPKKPIMPGESATIDVRYATDRVGPFTKTVTVTTNEVAPTTVLTIKGEVKAKADGHAMDQKPGTSKL